MKENELREYLKKSPFKWRKRLYKGYDMWTSRINGWYVRVLWAPDTIEDGYINIGVDNYDNKNCKNKESKLLITWHTGDLIIRLRAISHYKNFTDIEKEEDFYHKEYSKKLRSSKSVEESEEIAKNFFEKAYV